MGLLGNAALVGFGDAGQTAIKDYRAEQLIDARDESMFQRQMKLLEAQVSMRREEKALDIAEQDKRRATEGTPENQTFTLNKLKVDEAKRQEGLINMRRDGNVKRADGGFDVLGDDGKVRSTDAEGNLVGAPRDARNYEGMSAQDIKKQDLDIQGKELQIQATKAQIANAAASAADRSSAQSDKAALKEEYALLGHYLTSKSTNPKGDYSQQIAASVSKIAALGGNPSVMVDMMLGKQTTEKVATKTGDTAMGEPEVTVTSDRAGPRSGGVFGGATSAQVKPADTAALKGIIATAKSRGYNNTRIAETLKANGYTDAQIKAAGV